MADMEIDQNLSLAAHLTRPYPFTVVPDPDDGGYAIAFPDLPGCITQAESAEDIVAMANEARTLWIETEFARGHGIPIPASADNGFGVRVPKTLHRHLRDTARREGIDLDAWVAVLLTQGRWSWRVTASVSRRPITPSRSCGTGR